MKRAYVGYVTHPVASNVEIERALAAIATTLNDQRVDEGGGLHDAGGTRLGAVRRTPSGEWIVERQNETAERSDTAIPTAVQNQSPLRRLLAS